MTLKQQYERLSTDYEQLHQMVMDIRSQMGIHDICAPLFWPFDSGNKHPPPPPPPATSLF